MCANLQARPRLFVPLRTAADSYPHDILGPCGSLRGDGVPSLIAATDGNTASGLRNSKNRLLAAFDIRDLAILRSVGLPATLANGLAELDGSGLRRLLGQPQGHAQCAVSPCASAPAQRDELWNSVETLVLVGWSIGGLSLGKPRGFPAVSALFGRVRRCFAFDTSRIMVWRPTQVEFQQIELAVGLRDEELVRQVIVSSAASSLRPIEHYANDNPAVPVREAFRQARETLMAELRLEQDQQLLSIMVPKFLKEYNRTFERAFVEALVGKALSGRGPDRSIPAVCCGGTHARVGQLLSDRDRLCGIRQSDAFALVGPQGSRIAQEMPEISGRANRHPARIEGIVVGELSYRWS